MYSEYWNLVKPPFDNVPDSSMYVDCHVSMEDVIAETIYAIKEGNECLTVIVGEVGLGKTLSLRVIIDSLEPEKYKVALITNPALSFIQLLREIIGQITGKQCLEKKKVDLLEIFNRLLFETADQGKKIVIVIDEANVIPPSVLDDIRMLTNMQDDDRNLFTLLLVGQMEFARVLEKPKHANLFQRVGTYGHLEKLPSKEAVQSYIEARLRIAGTEKKIFSDDSIPVIWEFSEHGVPRLINKICKLCLKAGETNEFDAISAEVAAQIADRFQKLGKTARKTPSRPTVEPSEKGAEEPEKLPKRPKASIPKAETPELKAPARPTPPPQMEEARPVMPERPPVRPIAPIIEEEAPAPPKPVVPEPRPVRPIPPPQMEEAPAVSTVRVSPEPPVQPVVPPREAVKPAQIRPAMIDRRPVQPVVQKVEETAVPLEVPERLEIEPREVEWEEAIPVKPRTVVPEQPMVKPVELPKEEALQTQPEPVAPEAPTVKPVEPPKQEAVPVQPRAVPLAKPSAVPVPPRPESVPIQPKTIIPQKPPIAPPPVPPRQEQPVTTQAKQQEAPEQPAQGEKESFEDVLIGQQPIKLTIPAHVIRNAQAADPETKNKLAGYWSAQILKGNPQLAHTSADPVSLWFDVKNVILKKFNSR
ncbi:MAG TPA: AAA family ATPase [Smithella sp.]|nr:AAA family ATPase [Smithella sp.]HNY50723.1 AAA family ATPase [Smithella sp.]HOG90363.1 AAA family ATPase [Smithella sp.]HOU50010.1 AAA family ATPase [Smithella sp.]HQG64988.1 AAA family ATPase [Smithella sp.]